ncbi:hypothetical protein EST38_g5801 [Candolleomyces aberdarensis]|uniref:Uncharacterized protein n=1 Tax=Candolleomyces aberdarensis TaxID=2316362 RepID=A0A4Q2DJF6_9AGAR|nr:hypothetical protein EST38_g5801 [Candolleomyces aberdarensis]
MLSVVSGVLTDVAGIINPMSHELELNERDLDILPELVTNDLELNDLD